MRKLFGMMVTMMLLCSFMGLNAFGVDGITGGLGIAVPAETANAVYRGETAENVSAGFVVVPGTKLGQSTVVKTADNQFINQGDVLYFRISSNARGEQKSASREALMDGQKFLFRTEAVSGGEFLSRVRLTEQVFFGTEPEPYIAIELANVAGNRGGTLGLNVYFQAVQTEQNWLQNDIFNAYFELDIGGLMVSEHRVESDKSVAYQPTPGGENTLIWTVNGVNAAYLSFFADANAGSFNAGMSTKFNNDLYEMYGRNVNARFHYRSFGDTIIPAAQGGTLTLTNPFDWEVAGENVRIYNVRGTQLTDVTYQFSYSKENNCFSQQVRTLGNYIFSDKALTGAATQPEDGVKRILPVTYVSGGLLQAPAPTGQQRPMTGALIGLGVASLAATAILPSRRKRK